MIGRTWNGGKGKAISPGDQHKGKSKRLTQKANKGGKPEGGGSYWGEERLQSRSGIHLRI